MSGTNEKWRPECRHTKPVRDFFNDRRPLDGKTTYCKPCLTRGNAESRARRARGERVVQRRPRRLLLDRSDEKKCCSCGEVKPLTAFAIDRTGRRGAGSYCLPCHNPIVRANVEKNHGSTRDVHLERRYGLTSADVAEMVTAQRGACATCAVRPAEHLDHYHETGAVRGVLCFTCDVGLGNVNDEPDRLLLSHRYLTRHPAATGGTARLRRILQEAS